MYHELKHIGMGPKGLKIEPHDVENFSDILEKYGLDWNMPDKKIYRIYWEVINRWILYKTLQIQILQKRKKVY